MALHRCQRVTQKAEGRICRRGRYARVNATPTNGRYLARFYGMPSAHDRGTAKKGRQPLTGANRSGRFLTYRQPEPSGKTDKGLWESPNYPAKLAVLSDP